jgi:anti-anti-sigma regulatory factor
MDSEIITENDQFNIVLEGKLTIEEASINKEVFNDAYSNHQSVCIDLEQATDIDISGIQLLCSASIFFEKNNKKLTIKSKNNDKIIQILNELGYNHKDGGCHEFSCNNCLWKGNY